MDYYFAYGSNLSKKQMKRRGCNILGEPFRGSLKGYRLCFSVKSINWKCGVADITQGEEQENVHGVLYPVERIEPMDPHEACNYNVRRESKYYRDLLYIESEKGIKRAWVYYVRKERKQGAFIRPSWEYAKMILFGDGDNDGGLTGFGFSDEIIDKVYDIAKVKDLKVLKHIRNTSHRVSIEKISEEIGVNIDHVSFSIKQLFSENYLKQDFRDSVPHLSESATYFTVSDKRELIDNLILNFE